MTKNAPLTPDIIRSTALKIIALHEEGVRQSQLFFDTKQALSSDYINVPITSIRNALWDLEKRFPEYVEKKKVSTRMALLYPTKKLTAMSKDSGNDREYSIELADLRPVRLTMLINKILEIAHYIELSGIEELTEEVLVSYSSEINPNELEVIFGVRSAVKQLKNYRNAVAHGNTRW